MEYFLGLIVMGHIALICILAHYNITPREAGYKFIRKVSKHPLPTDINKAPYHRTRDIAGEIHKPILLNIETSDGTGQICHPDVTYVKNGFGSGHWCYWMVCTPYPSDNRKQENPEIFASYDGITWEVPGEVKNPIVKSSINIQDHNSDPDMVFYAEKFWLFFREVQYGKKSCINRVLMTQSSDCINWSIPAEALCSKNNTEILSPAIICRENCFLMWTIEKEKGKFRIARRESRNGLEWDVPSMGNVIGLDPERHLWHIDVIEEKERLSALVVTSEGNGGFKARLHYGYSIDDGYSWVIGPFLMEQVYEFESKCQYRATFLKKMEVPLIYEIWYSAAGKSSIWSLAYLKFIRDENNFYPATPLCIAGKQQTE